MKRLFTALLVFFALTGVVYGITVNGVTDPSKVNGVLAANISKVSGVAYGWKSWGETSEATLASADIFVCLMEDTDAGDDETGQGGGLAGVNLVLTQAGNIAGMVGGWRTFDGGDDEMTMTAAAVNALICNANKTWTIVMKLDNIDVTSTQQLHFRDTAGEEFISLGISGTSKLNLYSEQDNSIDDENTTDSVSAATEYYFAIWADGTDMRYGFTTTRPTKYSDFDVGKRIISTDNTGDYVGEDFANSQHIGSQNGALFSALDLAYIVVAKICLIDNDS